MWQGLGGSSSAIGEPAILLTPRRFRRAAVRARVTVSGMLGGIALLLDSFIAFQMVVPKKIFVFGCLKPLNF